MANSLSSHIYPALTCAVCGDNAGRWKQHHNRDTGYGVCKSGVEWLINVRHASDAEMKNNYGIAGVNYKDPSK
jgi:hypothetical protein